MMGFTAEYADGAIAVDRSELEDAAWFSLDALPPTFSSKALAGSLIERERAHRARPQGAG
jgi:NAD+ diphosphatase